MYKSLIILLRRKTTIRFRIYLFAGAMLFLFYIASIFSFMTHLNDVKEERKKAIDFVVTELLTKTAGQALWRGNKDQLESVMTTLLDSTEIQRIIVLDSQGEVFASIGEARLGLAQMEKLSVDVYWKKLAAEFSELDTDLESVADRKEKIGEISVDVDQDAISELVWSAMIEKSYALFIALILSMPVAYILVMSLVRPLRGIMEDLKRFESGDYSLEIPESKYRDEYAMLSAALGRAGASIMKKTSEIEAVNKSLRKHSEELENQMKIAIEARKSADEANERKDIFVANITHEFNRPLAGIVSVLKLIEDDIYEILSRIDDIEPGKGISEKEKIDLRETIFKTTTCVDTARYASNEISEMVNEILASIQDVYDGICLNERRVRLTDSLMKLVKSHELYAKQKGLDFEFTCSGCDDVWVITDWIRVAQILNSLIGNAIKFTERGGVSVGVCILTTSENVSLYVEVKDTGIGVTGKEKDAIFNLFHIGQHPRTKIGSGIGTGLAIAKKITEKLGGNISLKSSSVNMGSCFTFDCTFIRVVQEDENDLGESHAESKEPLTRNISLLYVEDSMVNQMIFQQYCMRHGVNLIIASSGEEGFEKYTKGRFDALVVDCYMPLGDGFDMVSKVREHEQREERERSLIFALTGDNTEKNRKRCEEYGLDEFLAKPYTEEAHAYLMEKVTACMKS